LKKAYWKKGWETSARSKKKSKKQKLVVWWKPFTPRDKGKPLVRGTEKKAPQIGPRRVTGRACGASPSRPVEQKLGGEKPNGVPTKKGRKKRSDLRGVAKGSTKERRAHKAGGKRKAEKLARAKKHDQKSTTR